LDKDALIGAVKAFQSAKSSDDISISVIPIAVDTKQLYPAERNRDLRKILTLGTLYYPPNADGIRWFVQEVFPLISKKLPDVELTIVGRNPPDDLVKSAEKSNGAITVTGYVTDLDPYFDQSALVVVPVRAGGGMRVRILEAFARGMPVVTTSLGLEGIEAVNNDDVFVRDTPPSFAAAVIQILEDKEIQTKLAANGRQLAENRYDWQVVLEHLELIYKSIECKRI
jgi:polysaccharide biosynthesis protein PslH